MESSNFSWALPLEEREPASVLPRISCMVRVYGLPIIEPFRTPFAQCLAHELDDCPSSQEVLAPSFVSWP